VSGGPADALVVYRRSGGREPSDDERLDVWSDGRFEARRTVGGRRLGRFAGRLEASDMAELQAAVEAVGAAGDLAIDTPLDGATVSLLAAGHEVRVGSNEQVEGPWGVILGAVKALLDGPVPTQPEAAIELDASAGHATLRHVGGEALEVDPGTITVRAVRLDAQGAMLGRWQGSMAPAQAEDSPAAGPAWTEAAPGWQLELPFRHGLELTVDDWLQVWVTLRLRDAGERRTGRLFLAVPGAGAAG
jgi:hypothetical protein